MKRNRLVLILLLTSIYWEIAGARAAWAFDPQPILGPDIAPVYQHTFEAPHIDRIEKEESAVFNGSSVISMVDPSNPLFGDKTQKELLGTDEKDMGFINSGGGQVPRAFAASLDPFSRLTTNTFGSGYLNDHATSSLFFDAQNSEAVTVALNVAYQDPVNLNATMSWLPNMILEKAAMLIGRVADTSQRASSGVAPVIFAMIDQCITKQMVEAQKSFTQARSFCEDVAVVGASFLAARGGQDGNCEDKALILANGSATNLAIIKGIIGNDRLCAEPIGNPSTPDYVLSFRHELPGPTTSVSEIYSKLSDATSSAITAALNGAECDRLDPGCTEQVKTALTELAKANPLLIPTAGQLDTLLRGYQESARESLAQYLGRRHANAAIGALCRIAAAAISKGRALGLSAEEQAVFDSKYAGTCGAFEQYMNDYKEVGHEIAQFSLLLQPGAKEDRSNAAGTIAAAIRGRGVPSMTFGGEGFQRGMISK